MNNMTVTKKNNGLQQSECTNHRALYLWVSTICCYNNKFFALCEAGSDFCENLNHSSMVQYGDTSSIRSNTKKCTSLGVMQYHTGSF